MNAETKLGEEDTAEGLNHSEAERLLDELSARTQLADRIDQISERFLGRPYVEAPLGGGAGLPEVFTVSLNAFDCVTYIETVIACALSRTLNEVVDTIRELRYESGEIAWSHRNHYMIDWARRNESRGFIQNITTGEGTIEKTCKVDTIPGLPAKTISFRYFAKHSLAKVEAIARTGDLIFFVSEKDTLDVFHTGLLIKRGDSMLLRHATRTAGAVIEQPLIEFVTDNEPAGFILLRPVCQP